MDNQFILHGPVSTITKQSKHPKEGTHLLIRNSTLRLAVWLISGKTMEENKFREKLTNFSLLLFVEVCIMFILCSRKFYTLEPL